MNVPGFTAEVSLYKTTSQYHLATRGCLDGTHRNTISLQSLPSSIFGYRSLRLPPSISNYCRCIWIPVDVVIIPEPPFYRVLVERFCYCG